MSAVELQASDAARWSLPSVRSYAAVDRLVTAPLIEPAAWSWRGWWIAFVVSAALTGIFLIAMLWLFVSGIGIWGVNSTIVWGFAIANYVWWIGIGNAGTLISAMLLLMRQHWRASINRFAEAMTIFAAAIAGLFPIMHLGRPLYFYWLVPYPNTHDDLAAVAQRADLGFLGDPELSPVLDHLLVRGPAPRRRHGA